MEKPTPRINAPLREKFIGQTIRIIGKTTQLQGDTALIDAQGQVTVHLNREYHLHPTNFVEVVGKVNEDLSIQLFTAVDFGDSIDPHIVEALVDIAQKNREIFY